MTHDPSSYSLEKMAEKIASTQEQLDIVDIKEGLVLLRSGGAAMVLQTNAVNFDLLSEKEQDAMIAAYSTFLNSLPSYIQIIIRSRKLDITAYLKRVEQAGKDQPNPHLLKKISSYRDFINGLVQKGEVLDKRFFIVLPYFEPPVTTSLVQGSLQKILGMQPKPKLINMAELLQRAKMDLEPRKDHVIKQLGRLGIKAERLATPQLIELFYGIYNPGQAATQQLDKEVAHYTTPLVEAAIQKSFAPQPAGQSPTSGAAPTKQSPLLGATSAGQSPEAVPPKSGESLPSKADGSVEEK